MKRKNIRLLIAGKVADLADDNLILWNYTIEDLESPAAIKNSYTQSITLPATPANNIIFGHIGRHDRTRLNASSFNPMDKTAFEIRNEREEILMEGYLKLDNIAYEGGNVNGYAVTLYGGLGSFLYGLMYKSDGTKRKLSDLNYTTGGGSAELSFTINKATLRKAWKNINSALAPGATDYEEKWHVINFAPAYEGIPSDFDANKVLVDVLDGNAYLPTTNAHNGHVLAETAAALDASEVRDFRSYLQRPVIKVSAVLGAISDAAQNGGYTIHWQSTDRNLNRLWCTLKPLTGVGYSATETFTNDIFFPFNVPYLDVAAWVETRELERAMIPSATTVASYTFGLSFDYNGTENTLYKSNPFIYQGFAIQLQALNEAGDIVGYSPIRVFTNGYTGTAYTTAAAALAQRFAYGDNPSASIQPGALGHLTFATGSTYSATNATYKRGTDGEMHLTDASNNTTFTLSIASTANVCKYRIVAGFLQNTASGSLGNYGRFFVDADTATSIGVQASSKSVGVTRTSTEERTQTAARTGATFNKAMLLDTDYSPADFLLSYCKQMGWLIVKSTNTKDIYIISRDDYYGGGNTIDIDDRIDRLKEGGVTPCVPQAKIYRLAVEQLGSEPAQTYEALYGATYGEHRLNTNYGFEGEPIDIIKDNIFKGAIQYTKVGHRYALPVVGSTPFWSWQTLDYKVMTGTKGSVTTTEFSGLVPVTWSQYNNVIGEFVDAWSRPLFADGSGNQLDGQPVLLYYQRGCEYSGPRYIISDDSSEMFYQNDNRPCWYQAFNAAQDTIQSSDIPQFRRHLIFSRQAWRRRTDTLDMGDSRENYDLNINRFDFPCSYWDEWWDDYMTDRYDADGRIVTAYVDLRGLTVDEWLLRNKFHFGGCNWRLNKVTDFDVNGDKITKCEFIKTKK